jgi:TRAP-type C4-dicarboxylate transport system substrate-binding protein
MRRQTAGATVDRQVHRRRRTLMKHTTRVVPVAALAAAVALLAGGCTAAAGNDKSGGTSDTTVLRLANNDGSLDGAPALRVFVSRLSTLSHGHVTVAVTSHWKGGNDEPQVIKDVGSGAADLGWAGTRAFDQVGVDAFRPLSAPLLIDSYGAESAVVRDTPLVHRLLGAVTPLGITGLALVADELRIPAGVSHPMLAPADFTGQRFATVASAAQSAGLSALGATPTDQPIRLAAAGGGLGGFETMPWTYQANNYDDFAPYLTTNVHLWPRSYVIFVGTNALKGLDRTAREWVEQAATDAAAWSAVHAADRLPAEIAKICQGRGRFASASPAQLAALRQEVEPVYAQLRSQPAQRATLTRIEQLVATAAPDQPTTVPPGCAFRPGDKVTSPVSGVPMTAPGGSGRLPQGTYRYALSIADLTASHLDDEDVRNNAGVFTWKLHDGRWSYRQVPVDPSVAHQTSCEGYYDVHGDVVSFTTTTVLASGECGPPTWTARWRADGRQLSWSSVSVPDFALVWAHGPWQRLG